MEQKRESISFDSLSSILYQNPLDSLNFESAPLKEASLSVNDLKEYTFLKKWSVWENEIYLKYLKNFPQCFGTQLARRKTRIFKKISDELGGKRDPEQVRGHHKKMAQKNRTIQDIIELIEVKIAKMKRKQENQQRIAKKKEMRSLRNSKTEQTKKSQIKEVILKEQSSMEMTGEENQSFLNFENLNGYQPFKNLF